MAGNVEAARWIAAHGLREALLRICSFVALALALLGLPQPVCAQGKVDARPSDPAYESAVKLGFEEFQLGNYVEARARFGEAHKLRPNARTLRALGMVEYELKQYVQAIRYLQDALASHERPLTDAQRAETEALLSRADGYVTRYRFALTPAAARLTVDGAPQQGDLRRGVLLAAGEHVVEASAPGHESTRRIVQVLGGEGERELTIALSQGEQRASASAAPARQEAPKRARKAWIWGTVAAVLVGGAVAGLVLGLRSKSDQPEVNRGTTGVEIGVPRGMALEWR